MASQFTTQTQRRAMQALGLQWPQTKGMRNNGIGMVYVTAPTASYAIIARTLQQAGVNGSGLPNGYTFRQAAKLTLNALANALRCNNAKV